MDKKTQRSYVILLSVSVLCLIVIVTAGTFAFFNPIIKGEGKDMNIGVGKAALEIDKGTFTANNLYPITADSKNTKAISHTFTVKKTEDTTLKSGICYDLLLVIESIGDKLKSTDFKYELVKGSEVKSGDFQTLLNGVQLNEEQQYVVSLKDKIQLGESGDTYTLKVWLQYEDGKDQSEILKGDASTRTFTAHVKASGQTGTCKTE